MPKKCSRMVLSLSLSHHRRHLLTIPILIIVCIMPLYSAFSCPLWRYCVLRPMSIKSVQSSEFSLSLSKMMKTRQLQGALPLTSPRSDVCQCVCVRARARVLEYMRAFFVCVWGMCMLASVCVCTPMCACCFLCVCSVYAAPAQVLAGYKLFVCVCLCVSYWC